MEMTNVTSVIALFPTTKTEQNEFVRMLVDNVMSGNTDPLSAEVQICNIEQVCKAYRANTRIKNAVLEEAEKYGQKSFDFRGANIQIKEVGVKYHFDEAGHKRYNELISSIELLTAEKKELETVMKARSDVWIEVDKETGEAYEVMPVAKTSTTQAVITIKP